MNKYLKLSLVVVCILAVGFLTWQIIARISNKNKTTGNKTAEQAVDNSFTADNGTTTNPTDQKSTDTSSDNSEKITIAKIAISAPIINNVDGNNMQAYLTALENGVAHLKQTALPGEAGNTVIFGHSSYYKAKPGSYKTVFAKLDQLVSGDIIKISFNSKDYNYKVVESKIVEPNNVAVVNQDKSKKQLTLITCWPAKTTTSRMVVIANLQ